MNFKTHINGKKIYLICMALFLIFCILAVYILKDMGKVVAEEEKNDNTKYVSDIRLFYALDSIEAAKNKCEDSGFIPVEGDLNKGTDKNHVVMGYKVTDDESEAITSIKLLQMDSGYELTDYEALQKEYANSNSSVIDTIEALAIEFKANYKKGSPKAKEAYEGLNLISIPEENNMKLGVYIVEGKADWDFYSKIVTRSSAGTISAIIGYLTTGVTPYENEYDSKQKKKVSASWAKLVKDSTIWEEIEEAETEDEFDDLYKEYGDDAKAFHKQLQEFATGYDNANANFEEGKYINELESYKGKTDEEVLDIKDDLSEDEQGAMYLAIYDELNQYEAYDGELLGDYLINLGYETAEDVELVKLYPILDCMTYAERRIAVLGGLFSLMSTAGENVTDEKSEKKLKEASDNIEEITGKDSYSIWMNNNEDLKGKKVAYTSDAIRANASQELLDNYDPTMDSEKANEIMKWVNLALGIVSCVLILAKFTAIAYVFALIPAAFCAIAAACGLTCAATTLGAIAGHIAGFAAGAVSPVGWIVLAILLVSLLVIWVWSEIEKYIKENKDIDYEDAPDYAADLAKNEDGEYLAYYKGVGSETKPSDKYEGKTGLESEENKMNYHGSEGISDVNGRMGFRGWNCMFFTKDKNIGSPVIVREGEDPFHIAYGGGANAIKGYDNVKDFGEVTPGNCNALMKKDEVGGIYIHYRTLKSAKNGPAIGSSDADSDEYNSETDDEADDEPEEGTLYYSDIIVRSADTEAGAKAKITVKDGFKVWDNNLANDARKKYSRHEEWAYTYLGFKTTTDPTKAITDIRVATFTPNTQKEVSFGQIKYGCAGNLGYKAENVTEDEEYPNNLDGLWFTKDENAGTPIELNKLHLVSSHKDGEYVNKGWVPVTTFSGVPYNFASTRDTDTDDWEPGRMGNYGYSYTCYQTNKDNKWECPSRYLYYEPEKLYTSGTKYLSAVFFTFGTDSESTAAKVGETLAKYSDLVSKMKQTPNTVVKDDNNLAKSFYYKGYIVESNQKYLNIGYSWSYNPYRAITDIKAFQGTIFNSNLPYTLNKPISYSGTKPDKNAAYDAVTVITQRTTIKSAWVTRGIGPENAYMSPTGLLGTNKQVPTGYTSYKPGGYDYSQEYMPFISSGLYVSGYVEGVDKLTLDDVIISSSRHDSTNEDGVLTADVSGEKTLGGNLAEGDFNSIQEMKNPYETTAFNIAYPTWTDDEGDKHDAGTPCYIYTRKQTVKKKYISKIFVGSFSLKDADAEDDYDVCQEVAKQVDLNALVAANNAASDEVIPSNVALVRERTWYGTKLRKEDKLSGRVMIDSTGGWYHGDHTVHYANEKEDKDRDSKYNRLPWAPPYYDIKKDGDKRSGGYEVDYVNRPASYLSVARTDNPEEAIRGILLYKSSADTVPEKIQVDGVEYTCASISTPIYVRALDSKDYAGNASFNWTNTNYFLYYTYNKGISPGLPFTEVSASKDVFISHQATALCADSKDKVETSDDNRKTITERAKLYGESKLAQYIHSAYEKEANMFFNKIYTANGTNEKDAMLKLLEQGCTEFCNLNLNEGASRDEDEEDVDDYRKGGDYVFFGYRGYSLDDKAIKSKTSKDAKEKERNEQLEEAVYDIVCTIGEDYHPEGILSEKYQIYYTPVVKLSKNDDLNATDLNAGTNGPPIYMYYTTPWVANKYNEKLGSDVRKDQSSNPRDYYISPLTRVCFSRYDRVPYIKTDTDDKNVSASSGDTSKPWEYVLYHNTTTPVDLNDGTVRLDNDLHTENNHISMFVQRESSDFTKEGAEITGGYMTSTAQVGEMWLNKD